MADMFKVGIALGVFSGLGLVMLSMMAMSPSEPAQATNLVGVSPFLRASGGAVKPMGHSMLPGSGPFKQIALAALEANDLRNMGRDVSAQAAQIKNVLSNMDANDKSLMVRAEGAVTSKAKDMAGVTAPMGFWDPAGFSTDITEGRLLFFREVELKHGRVGMLASLGILVAEKFHPLFGGTIDAPAYVAFQQTPLQQFWFIVAILIAIPEFASVASFADKEKAEDQIFTMKLDRAAGDFGFDPLGLKPKTEAAFKEMQNKEINNGRLAMLAAAGMIAQECATGKTLF